MNFRLETPSTDQPQKQIPSRTFIALICLTMLGQSAKSHTSSSRITTVMVLKPAKRIAPGSTSMAVFTVR